MGYALAISPDFDDLVLDRSRERADLLRQLLAHLKTASPHAGREDFAHLFTQAKTILELSDLELSELFQVSRPTIGRWERGESAPHPLGRKPLFDALAKVAKSKIRALSVG